MSGNFAIKGGGVGPLMANAILNFHFDFLHTSLFLFIGEVRQAWKVHLCPPTRSEGSQSPHRAGLGRLGGSPCRHHSRLNCRILLDQMEA